MYEPAQRLLVGDPAVLVGYYHRHSRKPADERRPCIRAELVRVQDVHALASKQSDQGPPRPQSEPKPPVQNEHANACCLELRACRLEVTGVLVARRTAYAERALEAAVIQSRGDEPGNSLRATVRNERVNKRHDSQLAMLDGGSGHDCWP